MPVMNYAGASIQFDVYGSGYPLLLFAPGGMNSIAQMWRESPQAPGQPMPWIDPTTALADQYQVIAMDQRNAGGSTAPVSDGDGWDSFSQDHVALLDHLGVTRTHLMGGCIGSSYCLGLCQTARARVTAAVLQNPIGLTPDAPDARGNRTNFMTMFDGWATQLAERRSDVSPAALARFRERMFDGDFVFSVDREFVRNCPVPLLVLAGNDAFHPRVVAEEIADLAPSAELVIDWAGPERRESTQERIRDFLAMHTPR